MAGTGDEANVPLGFGGLFASGGGRIAHFYRSREEMLGVLGPYVAEGIRRGDRCIVALGSEAGERLGWWLSFYDELSAVLGQRRIALSQIDLATFGGVVVLDAPRAHALCIMGEIPLRCSAVPRSKLEIQESRGAG